MLDIRWYFLLQFTEAGSMFCTPLSHLFQQKIETKRKFILNHVQFLVHFLKVDDTLFVVIKILGACQETHLHHGYGQSVNSTFLVVVVDVFLDAFDFLGR